MTAQTEHNEPSAQATGGNQGPCFSANEEPFNEKAVILVVPVELKDHKICLTIEPPQKAPSEPKPPGEGFVRRHLRKLVPFLHHSVGFLCYGAGIAHYMPGLLDRITHL